MLKKYINRKIPSYIALSIIAISAILVARYTYWEYMNILEDIYEVVEVRVSVGGERITFYGSCSDIADFWIKADPDKKIKECNNILSTQFKLTYKDSEARKCNLVKATGEICPPPFSGTRLVCIYGCQEEKTEEDVD